MADAESTTGESNEPVTALVNENVEHVNETIDVGAPSAAGMTTQEMLDAIQSSDEEPVQARASVETTTAAPAVAATVAATPAIAAYDRSIVAFVHHVEWRRSSSTEPPLNGVVPPRLWSVRNVVGCLDSRSTKLGERYECHGLLSSDVPSKAASCDG
jgi:hypothetical protein